MHQQIRVAANRGSEVRVSLIGKAEVPQVLRAVLRLFERAQQHGLQQLHVRPSFQLKQQGGVVFGMGFGSAGKLQAELLEELPQ